jgi:serine protease Do
MKLLPHSLRPAGRARALAALSFLAAVPAGCQERPAPADTGGVFRSSLNIDRSPLQRGGAILKSYADMLDKVQPSVVTILTGVETPQRQRVSREEQALRRLWGFPPAPEPKTGADRWQQIGIGSGVIVSANGYILTNRHVIFPPEMGRMDGQEYLEILRLRVNIPGREGHLPARLIDFSSEMDVAVIKIAGSGFPHATLTDSDAVRVGDIVFALGAPFGIDKTVTMGIISARRNDEVLEGFEKQELIQTDASINPGNSGGPLVDADGRVIGINTAIYSRTGGNMGIGFAIPINKAVSAADALSRPRGYLGVKLLDVDQRAARLYGFSGGAYVGKVEEGTPAAKSGLQEGDVILSVDGTKVQDSDDLRKRLAGQPPGTKMQISFFRESKEERGELTLTLGERPNFFLNELPSAGDLAKPAASPAPASTWADTVNQVAGMTLLPVDAEDRAKLNLPPDAPGLIITKVEPNTPAANCGLEKGDIILRINRSAPATHAEAVDAIVNHSREGKATVQVRKGDSTRIAVMDLK